MSSHREAPGISKDPVADSSDLYAFVSPENDGTITILANYVPLQDPAGGPNFFEFGDDVRYEIHIDNTGSGTPSITYRFEFNTVVEDPTTFLYNTGPIRSLTDSHWNRRQFYTVTRIQGPTTTVLTPKGGLACPPCNVGALSCPNYAEELSGPAVYTLGLPEAGMKVFAGQRAEGFFVDLGSVFDLLDLRTLGGAHDPKAPTLMSGYNSLAGKNVHTIALRLPISSVTSNGQNIDGPTSPHAVIGVYTTASRQQSTVISPGTGTTVSQGQWVQVSRLGNPLVNEVVVPMSKKDYFNAQLPVNDSQFAAAVEYPELQRLLPVLYPGAFTNLSKYTKPRADLVAIFVTGIPSTVIPGFAGNYQGGHIAEMLRLNMGYPASGSGGTGTSPYGLLGGDLAGFPNGRRPHDDVVTIELLAAAGATIPLVDKTFKPDPVVAMKEVTDAAPANPRAFQTEFPYLADPHAGSSNPPGTPPNN